MKAKSTGAELANPFDSLFYSHFQVATASLRCGYLLNIHAQRDAFKRETKFGINTLCQGRGQLTTLIERHVNIAFGR